MKQVIAGWHLFQGTAFGERWLVRQESEAKVKQQMVCANCGIPIRWSTTVVDGKEYCCPGCAQGGPCDCDYDNQAPLGSSNPIIMQGKEGGWPRVS
jgi:hypothetical protein